MNRLVCRVKVTQKSTGQAYGLRVLTNEHGLLSYIPMGDGFVSLEYMGLRITDLPASFEEAGSRNYKVLDAIELNMSGGYSIDYKWVEADPEERK